jgi:hypothetical protein
LCPRPFCINGPTARKARHDREIRIETLNRADADFDRTLRPGRFGDFVGLGKCASGWVSVAAAKGRGDVLDHVLCAARRPRKTTLAYILGAAMGAKSRPPRPHPGQAGRSGRPVTNLEHGELQFIDEIHRIQKSVRIPYSRWRISPSTSCSTRAPTPARAAEPAAFTLVVASTRAAC